MKLHSQSGPSSAALLVLVLFYVLLIVLMLVFAERIIANISNTNALANTVAIVAITFVLPAALLGAIVYNVVKLIRERTRRRAGSKLKTKLIFFFALIALLALVPQALLSITFIGSAINFWFGTRIGDALEGGLALSLQHRISKVENLERFSESELLPVLLEDLPSDPDRAWQNIQNANPEVSLFQVFTEDGREVYFAGPEEGRIQDLSSVPGSQGSLPTIEVREQVTILKRTVRIIIDDVTYHVVLGIVYPKRFDHYASLITESRSHFNQLFRYERLFRVAVVLFFFLSSSPIFLLSIMVSFLLTDEIIRPIVNLEEATKRISEGDFSFRVLSRTRDELSVLVGSFNRMISELEASRKKLVQAEKISAWRDMAQRLAHEIKNPLTPIKLSAQRILRRYKNQPQGLEGVLEPAVSAIIAEVDNLNDLIVEFREFTRLPDPRAETVDMKQLIEESIALYRDLSDRISFHATYMSSDHSIQVDRNQMRQVFANLFKNAVEAMPEGGEINISTDVVKKDNNRYFRIQIRDTGQGIDEANKEKIFEPYFTTTREGSGLGLPIVERIIFDHDGNIWFESKAGSGTTFFIDLPMER